MSTRNQDLKVTAEIRKELESYDIDWNSIEGIIKADHRPLSEKNLYATEYAPDDRHAILIEEIHCTEDENLTSNMICRRHFANGNNPVEKYPINTSLLIRPRLVIIQPGQTLVMNKENPHRLGFMIYAWSIKVK